MKKNRIRYDVKGGGGGGLKIRSLGLTFPLNKNIEEESWFPISFEIKSNRKSVSSKRNGARKCREI